MRQKLAGLAFVVAAAATALGLGANTAFADTFATLQYPVTSGSTDLVGPDTTVSLGPGTLTSTLDENTYAITGGTLSLPPATASFTVLGLPSVATTTFNQVGPVTGSVNVQTGAVVATAKVNIQITSLSEAGLPIYVGPDCQTVVPATITVTSQPGWGVIKGGTLAGTYSIPLFNNCGLLDALAPVINVIIPGPGNTISLNLGHVSTS
jgi:hypothetical protein